MGLNSLANSFKELGWGEGGKEAFYTLQNSQKSEVKKKNLKREEINIIHKIKSLRKKASPVMC